MYKSIHLLLTKPRSMINYERYKSACKVLHFQVQPEKWIINGTQHGKAAPKDWKERGRLIFRHTVTPGHGQVKRFTWKKPYKTWHEMKSWTAGRAVFKQRTWGKQGKRKEERNQTTSESQHCNLIPKIYGNHKKHHRSRDINIAIPPTRPQ